MTSASRFESERGGNDRVLAIIPARYASSRFPGKPLVPIAGKPMIQHVVERTARTPSVDKVIVATDDRRIAEAAEAEVRTNGPAAWVLNVQGDEPLIDPQDLERLIEGLRNTPNAVMGTLVHPLRTEQELHDIHIVKATLDLQRRALYFSRAPIPFPREPGRLGWRHLGVYLYRIDFLHDFHRLPATELSEREQLEQLRALEHGYAIHCFEAALLSIGVDVPDDIAKVEAALLHSN